MNAEAENQLKKDLVDILASEGAKNVSRQKFRVIWPTLTDDELPGKIRQFVSSNGWECDVATKDTDFKRFVVLWDPANPRWKEKAESTL